MAACSYSYMAPANVSDCAPYEPAAANDDEFSNLAATGAYSSTNPYLDAYYDPDGNSIAVANIHANTPAAADG